MAPSDHPPRAVCMHCGQAVAHGESFCCQGCNKAWQIINEGGFDLYYQRRTFDPKQRPLVPEERAQDIFFEERAFDNEDGTHSLHIMVDGIHCAACVWLIESLLGRNPTVKQARLNMTTRRMTVRWEGGRDCVNSVLEPIIALGYTLVPFDPEYLKNKRQSEEKDLLRRMSVAGFTAGNIMLFSISVWAGYFDGMNTATRDLLHWYSAVLALPTVAYCIKPFWVSALGALRQGRTNMDVPVCIGVFLGMGISLFETIRHGEYAFFDAGTTLLFFLLIGRYLDSRARTRARSAAEDLLLLRARAVTVLQDDDTAHSMAANQIKPGMRILTAPGERIGVDGILISGSSTLDNSLITGESLPVPTTVGMRVYAGTLNINEAIQIEATATDDKTLLAEIVRLMETAEEGRAGYRALADRVARYYAPAVHSAALLTFLGWVFIGGIAWQNATFYAVAVLIITCPCALALAVPVVQVVAAGWLMRRGILLKSATALERLAEIDHIVFDKTGTLTTGSLTLLPAAGAWSEEDLYQAASLAQASTHPLSRALIQACPTAPLQEGVVETAGLGLAAHGMRLGSLVWCTDNSDFSTSLQTEQILHEGPSLYFSRPGHSLIRFCFRDQLRPEAATVIHALKQKKISIEIVSGDQAYVVERIAQEVGIDLWHAQISPAGKHMHLDTLKNQGRRVLMVGDGLNDAPALAAAHISLSPASAADISQTAADIVFQGQSLAPVFTVWLAARASQRLMKQNLGLSLSYNIITIPLAIAGFVTPLLAAIFMSASSLVVILNSMRLNRLDEYNDIIHPSSEKDAL